ncbi:hypothetical protein ACTJJ7_19080 [Phyllobacterium sp. 22229]|uniref:hypothetical protein n=1 Tax=Phyllobacterium sp. 22229 TaxID=3453895 RepID=UPI003F828B20
MTDAVTLTLFPAGWKAEDDVFPAGDFHRAWRNQLYFLVYLGKNACIEMKCINHQWFAQ